MPPAIAAAFAGAAARSAVLPLEGRWVSTVGSTMDLVAEEAEAGAAEGLVVVAAEQTHGRGRRGRAWSSPPGGGLYLSLLFRPPALEACFDGAPMEQRRAASPGVLTLAAGVAVQRAIADSSGLQAQLKWPNDVMVGRRKLAGILAEGIGVGGPTPCIILGIGINLRRSAHRDEIAARMTSLEDELGRAVQEGLVLEEILVQTRRVYHELRHAGTDDILRAWRGVAPSAEGSPVEWHTPQGTRQGITAGIDGDGGLLVRTLTGVERVIAGELEWK